LSCPTLNDAWDETKNPDEDDITRMQSRTKQRERRRKFLPFLILMGTVRSLADKK